MATGIVLMIFVELAAHLVERRARIALAMLHIPVPVTRHRLIDVLPAATRATGLLVENEGHRLALVNL
jgi:hypothetical protein